MNDENMKAKGFVERLLSNPALQGLTPLQKEEQIVQFLIKNGRQLYPTLSSPGFFPEKNWEQILELLSESLVFEINKALEPSLKLIITDKLDLSFISFLRQQNWPQEKVKEELYNFVLNLLNRNEVRRAFMGPFTALIFSFIDRYIDQVFSRKEYVHFELTKVQRLRMSKEEIKSMIAVSMLLRPAIYLQSVGNLPGVIPVSGGIVQSQFANKVFEMLKTSIPSIPDQVLKSAVNSNVAFSENRAIEATARIVAVFASRCRNLNPGQKIDRGADTADKSWYSIARRNFKFHGFDVKMLDEFYKIAAENGW